MKFIIPLLLIIVLISCSSTTVIKTNDPKAKIFVDGELIGNGSAVHTDMKVSWLSSTITLKRDGCQDEIQTFSKNEQLDILPFISGFLFIVPFLWTMKYKAVHEYNYVCEAS
jgi:hypothetical protein